MKLLRPYLRRNKRLVLASLLFAALQQVFVLLDPVILRRIVDGYALNAGRPGNSFSLEVGLLLLAGVIVTFLAWAAKNYQVDFTHRATRGISLQLYSDGVRNSLFLPMETLASQRSGEIASKLQAARHDVDRYLTLLVNAGFMPLVSVIFLVVYASRIHWSLVAMYLIAIPAVVGATYLMGRQVREIQRAIVGESARLSGSAVETLRNIELVRSMGLARQESERVEASSGRLMELERRKIRAVRRLSFFHGAGVNALRLAVIVLMLFLVSRQAMTIGEFFSLFLYLYMLLNPIQEVANVLFMHREAEASLREVEPILSAAAHHAAAESSAAPLERLAFRDVSFTYAGSSRPAIDGLTFEASRGEFIAFAGPSGAGKSTLLKVLLGLYSPGSGSILFNGHPPSPADFERLRERVGLVTQDVQLFSGTIRDNLLFVRPDATDTECWEVLKQAAAASLMARAAEGLDTPIGEGGLQLSGGEKQRLAIARALLRRPEFLLFDEATSALDSLTEREVAATLRDLHVTRNVITIAIAHRLSTIAAADRIYVLDRGRAVDCGMHEELLARQGLYRELWMQQTARAIP